MNIRFNKAIIKFIINLLRLTDSIIKKLYYIVLIIINRLIKYLYIILYLKKI